MAIIYKFLTQESAFKVLESSYLKVAVISELNDAFDCSPDVSFGPDMQFPDDEEKASTRRNFIASIGKNFGLLCFTERCVSPLLWGHYANCSKGFALGFDFADVGNPGVPVTVHYKEDRPHVTITQAVRTPAGNDVLTESTFGYKAKAWEYEREIRFLVTLEQTYISGGMYYVLFPRPCLKEIVIGPRSSVDDRYLKLFLRQNYPGLDVKIRHAKPHDTKYEMELTDYIPLPFVDAITT